MEKVDRRIQRTQDLLGDALVSLIVEKGYDEVTIRDVTERANESWNVEPRGRVSNVSCFADG